MISVSHLTKTYRVARKAPGFVASMKSLVSRTYEEVHAVRDISFEIPTGARVGFLGPNGAGKTTTLKMLAGLLTPTAGKISVLGLEPTRRPRELLKQITLVMGQKQQLLWDLPPIETLELNRAVYEIDRKQYKQTLSELTEMLGLEKLLDKPTRQLSLGERMKCELTAALLHRPKVLFLDEPTIGLDVTMQDVVRRFIRTYNEQTGATILLTSHYMDDVAALCPRVIVIDQGRLKHDGDLKELTEKTSPNKRVHVTLQQAVARESIEKLGFKAEITSETLFTLTVPPSALTETVKMILNDMAIADLRVEDPPLEEVMRQFFGS